MKTVLKMFYMTGHSQDHIIYLWEKHEGVLFIGDAASNMNGLTLMAGYNNHDKDKENLKEIAGLNFVQM